VVNLKSGKEMVVGATEGGWRGLTFLSSPSSLGVKKKPNHSRALFTLWSADEEYTRKNGGERKDIHSSRCWVWEKILSPYGCLRKGEDFGLRREREA